MVRVAMLNRNWIRMEGRVLRPLGIPPRDHDVPDTESVSVLRSEMLDDSFEAVVTRIPFTAAPIT
jgi:hypothetical protein